MRCEVIEDDCENYLKMTADVFDLTFLDPPFNQGKEYQNYDDTLEPSEYWDWLTRICKLIYDRTSEGGSMYFMQREKNTQYVLDALEKSGWAFQNLIVWKKKTSAVPGTYRYGKHYQIIAFHTKGRKPRVFNRLRIDPPLLVTDRYSRTNGMYVTDVWDDIRELTSGYYAGDEPFRLENGERAHKQQSPVELLTRIILSSSNVGDIVFDPFAGTGTTLVVAKQLQRNSIGVEISPRNVTLIKQRLSKLRPSDDISIFRDNYKYTGNLDKIWPYEEGTFKQIILPISQFQKEKEREIRELAKQEVISPLKTNLEQNSSLNDQKSWEKRLEWVGESTKTLVSELIKKVESDLPEVSCIPKNRWCYFYKGGSTRPESLFAVLNVTKQKVHVRIQVNQTEFIDRSNKAKSYKNWFFKRGQEMDFTIENTEELDNALELIKHSYNFIS